MENQQRNEWEAACEQYQEVLAWEAEFAAEIENARIEENRQAILAWEEQFTAEIEVLKQADVKPITAKAQRLIEELQDASERRRECNNGFGRHSISRKMNRIYGELEAMGYKVKYDRQTKTYSIA